MHTYIFLFSSWLLSADVLPVRQALSPRLLLQRWISQSSVQGIDGNESDALRSRILPSSLHGESDGSNTPNAGHPVERIKRFSVTKPSRFRGLYSNWSTHATHIYIYVCTYMYRCSVSTWEIPSSSRRALRHREISACESRQLATLGSR